MLNRSGRVLLARQFVPITRSRLDGLLTAFPKLIGNDSQHTFIETEHVRYVYQLIDQLYLVLVTNLSSNIMEDVDTLRLLAKLVPEYANGQSEEHITKYVYELVFAFDEVISIGHRENVSVAQVRTYTDMYVFFALTGKADLVLSSALLTLQLSLFSSSHTHRDSHEEKLQKIIQESKMNEAREQMRQKADDIERKKMEEKRVQQAMGGDRRPGRGFGSGYSSIDAGDREPPSYRDPVPTPSPVERPASISKANTGAGGKHKGMQLGKGKKTTEDFFSSIAKEDSSVTEAAAAAPTRSSAVGNAAAAQPSPVASSDGVSVQIIEQIICELERDGSLRRFEIKGEMKLQVFEPELCRIVVHTNAALDEKAGWKCRLHPKMNKQLWASGQQLGLADPSKPFPVGSDKAFDVLKWRKVESDDSAVPLTLNVWPNAEDGETVVSCEYTMDQPDLELVDVIVRIPCSQPPNVTSVNGDWRYDKQTKQLLWQIGNVTQDNSSGSIEFSVSDNDADALFPIHVDFTSASPFSGLSVPDVVHVDSGEGVKFAPHISVATESYTVQ